MQKRFFNLFAGIITLGVIFCFAFLMYGRGQSVRAGSEENTSGYGWSDNIGWVSFNNLSDGSVINYGVNLSLDTGIFSGYAWSDNIGWISFNESDLTDCPEPPCVATKVVPLDELGRSDVAIKGWARALAGQQADDGWDGWIKFDHGKTGEAYIDSDGDWHGWAWGSDVVGWISFNGADPGAGGNYKVTLGQVPQPATATDLTVSEPSSATCCGTAHHNFFWIYQGSENETQFQIQVDNNPDFSSPEYDNTVTGDWPPGGPNNQTVIVDSQLTFGSHYYWRVKVWDATGSSDWIDGPSFDTAAHPYPLVSFHWNPLEPLAEEDVTFSDDSVCYSVPCTDREWNFTGGTPSTSQDENPVVRFSSDDTWNVSLEVTDQTGYTCSDSRDLRVRRKLPFWYEILPW